MGTPTYRSLGTQQMEAKIQYGRLTSKTSSSRILVPNTVMPSVLMTAWSPLASGLVTVFLQSTKMVTVFFSTLMATRCHLDKEGGHQSISQKFVESP